MYVYTVKQSQQRLSQISQEVEDLASAPEALDTPQPKARKTRVAQVTHTCTHMCMYVCVCVYMCAHVYTQPKARKTRVAQVTHTCTHMCMYVCVCVCVYTCVHMYTPSPRRGRPAWPR